MFQTFTKDQETIVFEVVYKPIKHVYFKDLGDYIRISCSPKMKQKDIIKILDHNFDKIMKLKQRKVKTKTHKYQLWGQAIDEVTFYHGLVVNEKNLIKRYILETEQQIKLFEEKLETVLKTLNLKLVPTKVKKLKSKYGSCQIVKKEITINAFMAKLDPIYLYYVLLHEYCHLNVANHSKAFYNELSKVLVNHKEIQKNLRKHVITF